ncbi:MAG TPA: transcriptional repressor [Candidatus Bipolaricaulota bacterium]|nr:transcriptional repressor [Candidatus Bipolaricaulota bacterium]
MIIKHKGRLTNQRKMILNYLLNTDSHPAAEEVFMAVKALLPQISFATVYRNLKSLVESGLIRALDFEKGPTRYDAKRNDVHFVCEKCKSIFDVRDVEIKKIYKRINRELNAQVHSNTIFFFGKCEQCLLEEKNVKIG